MKLNKLRKLLGQSRQKTTWRRLNRQVRLGAGVDLLEDRRLLTVSTPFVINMNDNWEVVYDNGDQVLSDGDVVESANDAGHTGIRSLYGHSGPDPMSPSTILAAAFGVATTSSVGGMTSLAGQAGFITIGDALAANDHGRINVLPGEYDENVTITLQQNVLFADGASLVHYAASDPNHLSPQYKSFTMRNQLGNVHAIVATDGVTNTSPAADIIVGDFTLANGSTFAPTNEDGQFRVQGTVSLNGATLNPAFLDSTELASFELEPFELIFEPFTLIDNGGGNPVVGIFDGLPEGSVLTTEGAFGETYVISYVGGDGNDVTLTQYSSETSTRTTTLGGTQNIYWEVSRQSSDLALGLSNSNAIYSSPDPTLFNSEVVHYNRSEMIGITFETDGLSRTAVHYNTATGETFSEVLNRLVFYNNSHWDANDGSIDTSTSMFEPSDDDKAVATDKIALLPGHLATLLNYTSYSKGLNGVMIDLSHLPKDASGAPLISLSDFTFKVGNNSSPSGWATAPTPSGFAVRKGAGSAASDRVVITWDDGDIANQWLQVTLDANANTGIVADDVFYFGNQIGDSGLGNTASGVAVNTTDELAARNNPRPLFPGTTPVTFFADYNRDGRVDTTDDLIARNNPVGSLAGLKLFTPPVPAGVLPYALSSPTAYTDFGTSQKASATLARKSGDAAAFAGLQSVASANPTPTVVNYGGSTVAAGVSSPDVHLQLTSPVSAANSGAGGSGTGDVDALETQLDYDLSNTPASELQNMAVTGRHYAKNRSFQTPGIGAGGYTGGALASGSYDLNYGYDYGSLSLLDDPFPQEGNDTQSWTIESAVFAEGTAVTVTGTLRISADELWTPTLPINDPVNYGFTSHRFRAAIRVGSDTVVDVSLFENGTFVNLVSSDFEPAELITEIAYERDNSLCITFQVSAEVGEDINLQFASLATNLASGVGFEQTEILTAGFSIDMQVS